MEVGGEVDGCREDTLQVLALGLAVELLPPLAEILELRIVVHQDLDLLAGLAVEEVTHGGVLDGCVLLPFLEELGALVGSTLEHGTNVETGQHDRQEAYRSKHGETSAHIVGNHEGTVAFLGREGLEGALLGIGDGHGAHCSLFLAIFILEIILYDAECHGGFGGGSGLGDHHASCVALLDEVHKFGKIILAEVVAGEYHAYSALGTDELVGKGLDGAAGSEVAASDADDDGKVDASGGPICLDGLAIGDKAVGSVDRKSLPAEEVVAGTFFAVEHVESIECFSYIFFVLRFFYEGAAAP